MILDFIKEKKFHLIFITIFFALGFTIEFFYRKPLFENSVQIAKSVQDSLFSSTTFFKYWAYLGVIEFFLASIFFFFFPISYCFTFFLNMIISVHLCNFAKLVYSQGRPFLLINTILRIVKNCSNFPLKCSYNCSFSELFKIFFWSCFIINFAMFCTLSNKLLS